MVNRVIHTPSFFTSDAAMNEYWSGGQSRTEIGVTNGWYNCGSAASAGTLTMLLSGSQTGVTAGFKFHYLNAAGSGQVVFRVDDPGGNSHCDLRINGVTGIWTVTRNGTLLLTSTTPLALNAEVYVEIQFVVADSGGVAILKVDGVTDSVINSSALDTRNAGSGTIGSVAVVLNTPTGCRNEVRDLYVNDNTGGVDDTFWGPIVVTTQVVIGAGTHADHTPSAGSNYQNVDDAEPDGDSTYNSTATLNAIDTFAMSDNGYSAGTVKGVEVVLEQRKTDSSAATRVAPVFRISGTDYVASDISPSTTMRLDRVQVRLSPATAAAWTVGELDGMEAGYKRTAL
jgi:hypothetical protein